MGGRGYWISTLALILSIVSLTGIGDVSASVYNVPIDYPDLQTALINAPSGSTIYVDTWQTISSPIAVNGKSGIRIVFRGGGIQTSAPYTSPTVITITSSSNIVLAGLRLDIGDVSTPSLSLVEVIGSNRVSIMGLEADYNGISKPIWLFGVAIRGASNEISLANLDLQGLSARSLVGGVLVHFVSTKGFRMDLNGMRMVDASSQGSVEGVTLATPNMDGWRVTLSNIWLEGLRGYGWGVFGVHIPGYSLVINTSISIYRLHAYDIGARLWPEAINIWSISGIWRDSRIVVRDFYISGFTPGYYPYSGIWINMANFDNASITIMDGVINNLPQPVIGESHGIGINLGMPFLPSSRSSVNVEISDVTIWDMNYGVRIMGSNPVPASNVDILVANTTVYNTDVGLGLSPNNLNQYRIGVENYRYLNRTGIGVEISMDNLLSDLHPSTQPTSLALLRGSEDLYIAYSIVWRVKVDYDGPPTRATLYETVMDEWGSQGDPDMALRSVWTLSTIVKSSITDAPLPGAHVDVEYPSPTYYDGGVTGVDGRFETLMDYYWSSVEVDDIWIGVSKQLSTASTTLDQYIMSRYGDPHPMNLYTLPKWYGEVILLLDIMFIRSTGFSHDLGTTILSLDGYIGYFASAYHHSPLTLPEKPYKKHLILVERISVGRHLIVIEGYIHYLGEYWPTTIYINRLERIIYTEQTPS